MRPYAIVLRFGRSKLPALDVRAFYEQAPERVSQILCTFAGMMKKRWMLTLLMVCWGGLMAWPQNFLRDIGGSPEADGRSSSWRTEEDTVAEKEDVPIGYYVWHIDPLFGDVRPCAIDTMPHHFQNHNFTIGPTGHYNTLGNLGSPRQSRLYFERNERMTHDGFLFDRPFDSFLLSTEELYFTNTKSPVANITYDKCGNKTDGEDHIRALFSTNAGKRLGMGFVIDYLYGRGYYANQSTAHFNGTLFGSYRGERYNMHAYYSGSYLKLNENGGLESDRYLTHPEAFPTKYGPGDMPTRLEKMRRDMGLNTLYLTHRYSVGYSERYVDSVATAANLHQLELTLGADSARKVAQPIELSRFIPVASFVHTLQFDHNYHRININQDNSDFFAHQYWPGDSTRDKINYMRLSNQLALEMNEGFKPWLKTGLRLFARHELEKVSMPDTVAFTSLRSRREFTTHFLTVGGQLFKHTGRVFHYDLLGELTTTGKDWGIFNVEGSADLNVRLRRDTMRLRLYGRVANERPSIFYRHMQTQHAWWDTPNLDNMFTTRVGAEFRYRKTRLDVSLASVQNYTYFASTATPYELNGLDTYRHGVEVRQYGRNLQVASATLGQDLAWGIFHWDTELTFQASSNQNVLPLPLLSAYSNVYLKFRIAKVLGVEFGADVRYFTSYYAPDYSPEVGQYSTQARDYRIKTGNYPFVNVYANLHLSSCRFYIMCQHVNEGFSNRRYFMTPHYPMNPMTFNFGISWTFYN